MFRMVLGVFVVMVFSLYGDYYTSLNSDLNSNKSIEFEDGLVVNVKKDSVVIKSKKENLSWFDFSPAKEFKSVQFMTDNNQTVSYRVYNISYMLKNLVRDEYFVLQNGKYYFLVKTDIDDETISTKLGKFKVDEIEYKIVKVFNKEYKIVKSKESGVILKIFVTNDNNVIAVSVFDGDVKKIIKSVTPTLKKFLVEKKKRVLKVTKIDFNKEDVYLTYVSRRNGEVKRLKVEYSMNNKNIMITMEGPVSILDPEYKDSSIEKDVGILREYKNELYELKKTQYVDDEKQFVWLNLPKKPVVVVDSYLSSQKERSIISKTRGVQFYSIEALFHLVPFMNKHHIDKKTFVFMNGVTPFDTKMEKTSNSIYKMKKLGNTIFEFELDNKLNIVKKILYPQYDVELNIESVDNDTTLENKNYLSNFISNNNLKLIKE